MDDDLTGVARDSETLLDALGHLAGRGFAGSFSAVEVDDATTAAGRIRCEACHEEFAADAPEVTELRRLEGASDPDDMLAVVALVCPCCAVRGSLVLNYGPTATTGDAAVLLALRDPDRDAH